jgi:nucleotide-binding universal stress UspA family protein
MALETIVVGLDGSTCSRNALRWARALATRTGARIEAVMTWDYPLLSVLPLVGVPVAPPDAMQEATEAARAELVADTTDGVDIECIAVQGSAAKVLAEMSGRVDLVVVGSEGEGAGDTASLGSTTRSVAVRADSSVAVIRADAAPLPEGASVLVAVDGSQRSVEALAWALEFLPADVTIEAVHSHDESVLDEVTLDDPIVVELTERAQAVADAAVAAAVEQAVAAGVADAADRVTAVVLAGDPRTTVLDRAADADLFLVGARGHTGLAGILLGSFATYALDRAMVPFVIGRPDPS